MIPVHVHIPYHKLRDYFELIKRRKYDLEVYFPAAVLDQLDRSDLDKLVEELDWNPALSVHAPFMDLNPGAVDPMIRSATLMRFRKLLTVASVLKPRAAVFHAAYDRWRYAGRMDIWLENSLDTWNRVMEEAARIGLSVALENVFDEDPEALQMLIERIRSPQFGFCLDTGHFNIFSKAAMEQWFHSLGPHLIELHLHDNAGTEDSHLAPGKGSVDFPRLFRLLRDTGKTPVFTLEAHDAEDIEPGMEQIRKLREESMQ